MSAEISLDKEIKEAITRRITNSAFTHSKIKIFLYVEKSNFSYSFYDLSSFLFEVFDCFRYFTWRLDWL
jgi:hypothetical protein